MSETPGQSAKGAGVRADVAPCLRAQTTVEFAGDDPDETIAAGDTGQITELGYGARR